MPNNKSKPGLEVAEKTSLVLKVAITVGMISAFLVGIAMINTFSKNPKEPGESPNEQMTIKILVSQLKTEEATQDGQKYHKLSIPESDLLTQEEGSPQIPYIKKMIEIPAQASNVKLKAEDKGDMTEYSDFLVYPAPKKVIKEDKQGFRYIEDEFYLNEKTYQSNQYSPKELAVIVKDGYFRSVRILEIHIFPVQYNPNEKSLKFYSMLEVELSYKIDKNLPQPRDTMKHFKGIEKELLRESSQKRLDKKLSISQIFSYINEIMPWHVKVVHAQQGEAQTPWRTNENGDLRINFAWNFTMGYNFTPSKSGQITKLGGFFNGTKTVYLWNKATGVLLGQATVSSANNWNYTEISPVSVQAGVTYTVAAYLASSGGSYRVNKNTLPQTYGDIRIEGTAYISGNQRPINNYCCRMYGQADIEFVPEGGQVNQPPMLNSVGNKTVNEGSLLTFSISATDPDGGTLTYSATGLPTGASFVGQAFSWTPNYNQASNYQVTLRVTDGSLTDEETITITVNNVNRAPELNQVGNKTVNEGSLLTFSISATDPDGGTLTYSATGLPTGATFNAVTQTFSWTPDYTQAGNYQVSFTVTDGSLTDSETINITVNNLNRVPNLDPIGSRSVAEAELLQFTVSATDPDGDTLTYSAADLPIGASFVGQAFSWTPNYNQAGNYQVTFRVTDGSLTDEETITITVNNVNRAPELNQVGNKTVSEGSLLTFTVSGSDSDGDTLTYSAVDLPTGASFSSQAFSWTPSSGHAGSYQVTLSVTDGSLSDQETITISVKSTTVLFMTGDNLRDTNNQVDYLIITHADFYSSTELSAFAQYRANYDSFKVGVVKVDDIYTQFPNASGKDYSIKDFVTYAYHNWQIAPSYLLLLGDAGVSPGWVPVHWESGGVQNDDWFAYVSGEDDWPDLAVGRMSVRTTAQISAIKDKIYHYEQDEIIPGDYHERVTLTGGQNPGPINQRLFAAGFQLTSFYDKSTLLNAFDSNYFYRIGHGSNGGWIDSSFSFGLSDLPSLSNNFQTPIIMTTSCDTADIWMDCITINLPGVERNCFGEGMVNYPEKGAVAYYGATVIIGPSYTTSNNILKKILDHFEYPLGQAVLLGEMMQDSSYAHEQVLLGDPALHSLGHRLETSQSDLTLASTDISYDWKTQELTVKVTNLGSAEALNIPIVVLLYETETNIHTFANLIVPSVPAQSSAQVSQIVSPPLLGEYLVVAEIDPENTVTESFKLNNQNGRRINTMDYSGVVVLDENSQPMVGISVQAYDSNDVFLDTAVTDDEGKAKFYFEESLQVYFTAILQDANSRSWLFTDVVTHPALVTVQKPPSSQLTVLYPSDTSFSVRVYDINDHLLGISFNPATSYEFFIKGGTQFHYQIIDIMAGSTPLPDIISDTQTAPTNTIMSIEIPGNPPVLNPIGNKTVNEGDSLTFTVSSLDPDGDSLTYSASGLPSGATFVGQTFSWTPNYNQAGSYSVTFSVSDGSLSDSETITITVNNVNRPPILNPIGNKTVNEGSLLTFTVSGSDPDGDSLTYSASGLPSGATFSNRVFTWTPNSNQAGTYNVTFQVSDGSLTDVEAIVITVIDISIVAQTPWQTNQNGTLVTNKAYNNTMGYNFTPSKSGQITKLGGFFNGTKTVYLWNRSTGVLLKQATVTSSNNWSYTAIEPVSVQAGVTYTVAAYLAGSGGSSRWGAKAFPQTYGDIRIEGTTYIAGDGRPTYNSTCCQVYGQVDIEFVP